jgi:hypothetical protein
MKSCAYCGLESADDAVACSVCGKREFRFIDAPQGNSEVLEANAAVGPSGPKSDRSNTDPVWSRPGVLGVWGGLVLAALLAVFIPASELKPGESRIESFGWATIVLMPGAIVTACASRAAFRNIKLLPELRLVWGGAVLFFGLCIGMSVYNERTRARRFAIEGRRTDGTVLETHEENHDTIVVAYEVAGSGYRVSSRGPRVGRSYTPGERIPVYYFASAPGSGFCTEPQWQPGLAFVTWILGAGVLPIWLIGIGGSLIIWRAGMTPEGALRLGRSDP